MTTVTISPKFQVVIPKSIRENMDIQVGQQFQFIQYGDRIEFIPVPNIQEMKGFLKGMDTKIVRERDRV